MIENIIEWNNIDTVKFKVTSLGVEQAIYYMDGHKEYDQNLTELDKEIVGYSRELGCYGSSEVMIDSERDKNQFYVRVNLSNDFQQEKILSYIYDKIFLTDSQKDVLEKLSRIDEFLADKQEYKSFYFFGFVKKSEKEIGKVKLYFQTDYDYEVQKLIINYIETLECFRNNKSFARIKKILSTGKFRLKIIGVEFGDNGDYKLKFYISSNMKYKSIIKVLEDVKVIKNEAKLKYLDSILENYTDIEISLIQVSDEKNEEESCCGFYLSNKNNSKKTYYHLNDNIRMRDIGGVKFLINICEKQYYDKKGLYKINEIGALIVKYMQDNNICNIDGIVSWIKSKIINYNAGLNVEIYTDCKEFVERLVAEEYIDEVN